MMRDLMTRIHPASHEAYDVGTPCFQTLGEPEERAVLQQIFVCYFVFQKSGKKKKEMWWM